MTEDIVDEPAPETSVEEAQANQQNLPPDNTDGPHVPRAGEDQ